MLLGAKVRRSMAPAPLQSPATPPVPARIATAAAPTAAAPAAAAPAMADFEGELERRLSSLRDRYPSVSDLEAGLEGGRL